MICEQCRQEGQTSCIYIGTGFVTCMGSAYYYDEQGKLHDHDPNVRTTTYSCSKGHHWVERSRLLCSSCDYNHEPLGPE